MTVKKSLHQHYHFIRQLALQLNQLLTQALLTQAFTTSKQELVLLFDVNGKSVVFKVLAQFQSGFILVDETTYHKGSNAQACFVNVHQQKVVKVEAHAYNRSFVMVFQNGHQLIFKCYDALVNVVEVYEQEVYDVFRESIQNDWQFNAQEFEVTSTQIQQKLNSMVVTEGEFWIYKQPETGLYALSLTQPETEVTLHTNQAIEASTVFAKYALGVLAFNQTKQSKIATLQGEVKRLHQQVKLSEQGIHQLVNESPFEEIGHIIMANLHTIVKGSKQVELFDFYHNKTINIKLKTDFDAAANAAYYYRKAKNKKIELEQMEQKLLSMRTKLATVQTQLQAVQEAQHAKQLKPFANSKKQESIFPFKKFTVGDFEIWVGKNAQNNDLLTQKYTHKNDLWLHAKDVSGSHTVIKHKAAKPFTTPVITVAAQIAAYYSKHKGNALAPVSYTLKKNVRKPKGAEPGSVVIDREEVIMVEPKLP